VLKKRKSIFRSVFNGVVSFRLQFVEEALEKCQFDMGFEFGYGKKTMILECNYVIKGMMFCICQNLKFCMAVVW
jgi:hypothetical protein